MICCWCKINRESIAPSYFSLPRQPPTDILFCNSEIYLFVKWNYLMRENSRRRNDKEKKNREKRNGKTRMKAQAKSSFGCMLQGNKKIVWCSVIEIQLFYTLILFFSVFVGFCFIFAEAGKLESNWIDRQKKQRKSEWVSWANKRHTRKILNLVEYIKCAVEKRRLIKRKRWATTLKAACLAIIIFYRVPEQTLIQFGFSLSVVSTHDIPWHIAIW